MPYFRNDIVCDSGSTALYIASWFDCVFKSLFSPNQPPGNQPAVFKRKLFVCEFRPHWLFRYYCKEAVRPAGCLNHAFGTFIFTQDECAEVLHNVILRSTFPALLTVRHPLYSLCSALCKSVTYFHRVNSRPHEDFSSEDPGAAPGPH